MARQLQAERDEAARQLQAEREEACATKEALEQQVIKERERADDELARVRAELDHERQQRDHDEEMQREAETQRILECVEETKQQLYNITGITDLAHRKEFMQAVDERWESFLEWCDRANRQFDDLFNAVQGIIDSYAEGKEREALRRRLDSSAHQRSCAVAY